MVKMIGMLLIMSSLLALAIGSAIDISYGSNVQITGNLASDIINQPDVSLGFFDYAEAIAFSYSIFSFIMGILFLIRV